LVGGLIPETLFSSTEPHQGTLDVDLLLSLALEYDREDQDYSWLETALGQSGFVKASPNIGWRWMVQIRAAGVGGYLAAKASAIVRRDLAKDLYDFAFVVIHAVGADGPDPVASAVARASVPGNTVLRNPSEDVTSACRRFDGPESSGVRTYAAEARTAGSTADPAKLQAQAQGAIGVFLSAFERALEIR